MERQKTGREIAEQLLKDYLEAVCRSDDLIAQYEALEKIIEPSSSQLARMKELEETAIPEAVAKDKKLKESVLDLLALPGSDLPTQHIRTLELRYLAAMGWKEVVEAVYGEKDDFALNRLRYEHRVFLSHRRGINIIGAALDRKMQSPAE